MELNLQSHGVTHPLLACCCIWWQIPSQKSPTQYKCARFTHNPRVSHGNAVKRICHYLQGTKTKGMIICPLKQLNIDCFVDADFAGQWNVEDPQDPLCVKSHTGSILMAGNCPVH